MLWLFNVVGRTTIFFASMCPGPTTKEKKNGFVDVCFGVDDLASTTAVRVDGDRDRERSY